MKKVIKVFVFFLIIMLVSPVNIIAKVEVNADQQAGLVYGCKNAEWCWPEGDFGGLVNGIRVSFYNLNAEKIGKSLDFINNNTAYNYLTNHNVYAANTKNDVTTSSNTKLDYIAKGCDYDGTNTDKLYWWWSDAGRFYGRVDDIYYLEFSTFLTGKSGISANVFKDYLRISDLNDIVQRFEKFEDQFKFPSGITLKTITANAKNYYIVIEPVTVVVNQYTRKYYYGTYAELQMLRLSYEKTNIREGDRLVGVDILFRKNVTESSGYSLAKSIYLGKDITDDTSSKMAKLLKELQKKTDSKDIANSYKKYNVYSDILDNGYGIGAMWLNELESSDDCNPSNPNWNATTKKCTSSSFETCTVKTPNLDVCATDNGNALEYEYTNCTLDDDDSNYIIGKISNTTYSVARIQCSEKYYVATFQVRNTFKTITSSTTEEKLGSGILAGAYYSIDGPVVYHKKTCEYVSDISGWEAHVATIISHDITDEEPGCWYYGTCDEPGCEPPHLLDKDCETEKNDTRDEYSNLAKKLKTDYNGMKDTLNGYVTNNTSPDTLPDLKLNTIISKKEDTTVTYDLTPTFNRLEDLRKEFGYGYKTTYTYGLKQKNGLDINRYISLISSSDALTSSESKTSVDLGGAKITTQINLKEGEYNYNINYQNIFNDTFKNIINKYGKYNIDTNNEVTSKNCPYIIYARNISSFCETNCGDPNTEFTTPKINMVYRAIDLSNPFPGYTGSGRESGLNWDTNSINQYITFNRNIVIINGDKTEANPDLIYQEEPLYTIKLDSTTIKAIRDYNDTHAYDDFTLECTEGTGTECFSTFLKDYKLITGGTCANATTDTFYSCADK